MTKPSQTITLSLIACLVAGLTVLLPSAAEADMISRLCVGQDRVVKRWVTTHRSNVITHAQGHDIPKHGRLKQSEFAATINVLHAELQGEFTIGGSAHWWVINAESETHLELMAEGEHTSRKRSRVTTWLGRLNHPQRYVFYAGRVNVTGHWHVLHCSRAAGHGEIVSGKLQLPAATEWSGAVMCPHTRWSRGSLRWKATIGAGC